MRDQLVVTETVHKFRSCDATSPDEFSTLAIVSEDGTVRWLASHQRDRLAAILAEYRELDVFVPYVVRNSALLRFLMQDVQRSREGLRVWVSTLFRAADIPFHPKRYWRRLNIPSSAGGPRLCLPEDLVMCDIWDITEGHDIYRRGMSEEARQALISAMQAHPVSGILGFFKYALPEWCALLIAEIGDPCWYHSSRRGYRPSLYPVLHIDRQTATGFLASDADKAWKVSVAMYAWGVNRRSEKAVDPDMPNNLLWRFHTATEQGLCQASCLFVDMLCDYWIASRSTHPTEWFVPENYFARVPYSTSDDLAALRTYMEVASGWAPSREV